MSENLSFLSGRKGLNYNLFEELGVAIENRANLDPQVLKKLKEEFLFGDANIYGTISFYDFLKDENKNKKIYLCNGSACLTAKTQHNVHQEMIKYFSPDEIGEMCCLGRCHENHSFHYAGNNYSGNSYMNLPGILKNPEIVADTYQTKSFGDPVIMSMPQDINFYSDLLKKSLECSPTELLNELTSSGLRGRGGAGFPTAFKLNACRESAGATKFIVCNADEGDPGAYSDRFVMEHFPQSLLLGMLVSGYIAGASHGVIYIRAEYPESIDIIKQSVQEFAKAGLVGRNILNSDFHFQFTIIKAQGAYICGEETALLSSIEGQRPEVRVRPPFPTTQGLFNLPTVVNNVETLACIPFIIDRGGVKFAEIGKNKSTGTKLISLDGFFQNPGIYEVEMGTELSTVIYALGGGFKEPIKAMQIGGPLGGIVPLDKIEKLTIDFESFQSNGFLLGHASIVCIPESFPIVEYIKHLFKFTSHESCGKCFPCRLGAKRGYELLQKATNSDYKIDRILMNDLLETLEIGSLCALGGGLPLPIKNVLEYFDEELKDYFH